MRRKRKYDTLYDMTYEKKNSGSLDVLRRKVMKKNLQRVGKLGMLAVMGLAAMSVTVACGKTEPRGTTGPDNSAEAIENVSTVTLETTVAVETTGATESAKAEETTAGVVGLGNPWVEADEETVNATAGLSIHAPEGATDVVYSYAKINDREYIAQVTYQLDGVDWVYRIQPALELTDISGMYYTWNVEEDGTVKNRPAKFMAYSDAKEGATTIDDVFYVQVVNWYDVVPGVTYSLSASGKNVNGMDISVYAESIFQPLQGNVG